MKKQLERAQRRLHRGRVKAFVSRVAWLDVERRIDRLFNEARNLGCAELGDIYLQNRRDMPELKGTYADSVLNALWIIVGGRMLNVQYADSNLGKMLMDERGGQLWFAQDATGAVTAFISPYASKNMRMDEKELIIARYSCATALSERRLRKHFATFFRYLAVTSSHGDLSFRGYLFRLRLRIGDHRYANEWRANAYKVYVPAFLAFVGLIATLYTGNKLKWLSAWFS